MPQPVEVIGSLGNLERAARPRRKKANRADTAALREERELRAQEKYESLTKITPPLHIPDEDSFLGFALVNIVDPCDGGRGPKLILSKYQRPLSKKQLRLLQLAAGPDGSGLRTLDFENAVYIAVDPALLEEGTLTQDLYPPHNRVQWSPAAEGATMVLLAGGHRQATSMDLVDPHDKEIEKLKKKITALGPNRREDRAEQIQAQIDKLLAAREPKCIWLAMFYDRGVFDIVPNKRSDPNPADKILESRDNSLTALLKLLTNNKIPPAADSEEHQLATVFSLVHDREKNDTDTLLSYSQTLAIKHRTAYLRLINRCRDFFSFLVELRASSHFRNFLTDSQRIVNVYQELWELIEPLFRSMWRQLVYIASDSDLPAQEGTEEEHAALIVEALTQPPNYVSSQLDEPGMWTQADEDALPTAFAKLHLLLVEQCAYKPSDAPRLDGKLPLFSPMCAAALIDDWWSVRDVVYLISNQFLPGLGYIQNINKGRNPSKAPFDSYPGAIRHYLHYFLGSNNPEVWSSTTVEHMLQTEDDDGDTGRSVTDAAFNSLITLLWRHREDILRPVHELIQPIPPLAPYTQRRKQDEEAEDEDSLIVEAGQNFLKQWTHASSRSAGGDREVGEENHVDGLLSIFEALQQSSLNYLVSYSGLGNNRAHHVNIILYVHREIDYFSNYLAPFTEIVKPFCQLLTTLFDAVQAFPGLESAPIWFAFPPEHGVPQPIEVSEYSELAVRKDRDSRRTVFDQALSTFVKRIAKADCLGVLSDRDEPHYRLHLGLKRPLEALRTKALPLQHHLAITQRCPDLASWPLVQEEWDDEDELDEGGRDEDSVERERLPMDVPGARFSRMSDLRHHYRSRDVQELRGDDDEAGIRTSIKKLTTFIMVSSHIRKAVGSVKESRWREGSFATADIQEPHSCATSRIHACAITITVARGALSIRYASTPKDLGLYTNGDTQISERSTTLSQRPTPTSAQPSGAKRKRVSSAQSEKSVVAHNTHSTPSAVGIVDHPQVTSPTIAQSSRPGKRRKDDTQLEINSVEPARSLGDLCNRSRSGSAEPDPKLRSRSGRVHAPRIRTPSAPTPQVYSMEGGLIRSSFLRSLSLAFNTSYDLFMCTSCQMALTSSNVIPHLKDTEKLPVNRNCAQKIERASVELGVKSEYPKFPRVYTPIDAVVGLNTTFKYGCPRCMYTAEEKQVVTHISTCKASDSSITPQEILENIPTQYFHAGEARRNIRSPHRHHNPTSPDKRLINPWIMQTGFHLYVKGHDVSELRAAVQLPQVHEPHLKNLNQRIKELILEGNDLLAKTNDQVLRVIMTQKAHE
ncbi:hypothetical protein DFP72DRAFT_1072314 [Ephemerocybe angulata]|uniref:Uncharacterized protein n=1 Tax=Ephemerocybe angulata TaxID=980116 RepID=A0A8H6HQK9_9AGAR|nr:hypothetical protein DFP72DRAFT_1072314 [Tulosesus angulatus]